jgi:pimeloyl-ACP methyl ester carboxylesterase
MISVLMKIILPIILAACTVPVSGNASERSVPSIAEVETLSVSFNDETIKGFYLFIDARTAKEKAADAERGYPAGPVIVFFHGHAQRPDDAYEFTGRLALLSKSGMVIIPVCDTPYGAKSSLHGDKGKDVILMEMVRFILAREGITVRGFVPVTSMPVVVGGLNLAPENDNTGTQIVSMGWSHGGILARRFAHAYPSSVCSLGQVCPAGYEHWGPGGLTGKFALESVRITMKMSGHAGQTFASAWGFTKGFIGDFFRSITSAAVNLYPGKLLRIFKDIRDCSRYCDSTTLAAAHLKRIAVIFGRDDSCMSPQRQLGIKDPDNVTEDDLKRFSRTFYSDIKENPERLTLRVLPGTHLAPVINNELYSRTILADLGELAGK